MLFKHYLLRPIKPLKWLAYFILISIVCIVVILATLLGTQSGRTWLVTHSAQWVSNNTDYKVEVSQFRSPQLGEILLDNVVLHHKTKIVAELNKVHFKWQPFKLVNKEFNVELLNINRAVIHIAHLPKNNQTEPASEEKTAALNLFETINSLPEAIIKKMALKRLVLKNEKSPSIIYQYSYAIDSSALISQNSNKKINLHVKGYKLNTDELFSQIDIFLQEQTASKYSIKVLANEGKDGIIGHTLKLDNKNKPLKISLQSTVGLSEQAINVRIDKLTLPVSNALIDINGEITTDNFTSLAIKSFILTVNGNSHSLKGFANQEKLAINLQFNRFDLSILSPWLPEIQNGKLTTYVDINGPYSNLKGTGKVLGDLTYSDIPIIFSANGTADKSIINLSAFNAKVLDANFEAKGLIDARGFESNLNINAKNININNFVPHVEKITNKKIAFPVDLSLKVDAINNSISGSLTNPNIHSTMDVSGLYKNEPLNLNAQLVKNNHDIKINHLNLTVAQSKLGVSGDYNLQNLSTNMAVNVKDFPFELLKLAQIDLPPLLTAKANAKVDISGTAKKPEIDGIINVEGLYDDLNFKFETDAKVKNNTVFVKKFDIYAQDLHVANITARFDDTNFDSSISIKDFPTKLLSTVGLELNAGTLNAEINANGTPIEPIVNGRIEFISTLNYYDNLGNKKVSDIKLNTQITTSEKRILNALINTVRDDNSAGEIKVEVPLAPISDFLKSKNTNKTFPLQAKANGEVDLQNILLFSRSGQHNINGLMSLNLALSGSALSPIVNGDVNVVNSFYANQEIGTELNNINCKLTFVSNEVSINKCLANDNEQGQYTLSGNIVRPLKGSEKGSILVELKLQDVNVIKRKEIESQTTGAVSVRGDFKELTAQGKLNVTPLSASIASNPPVSIPSIEVEEVYSFNEVENTAKAKASSLPIINLDLNITANKQAFLRGRGLDAELEGAINIYGTAANPAYDGEFNIVRGHIELFNKKFLLTNGQVTLANSAVGLIIRGSYQGKDQQINVTVSGVNEDIDIAFSAVPSLPEDEILAYIIFGKKVTDITPFEAIQLASAVQKLRGGDGGLDIVGGTRDALGVDTLSIESTTTDSGESGVNIGIGKYLNERVYIELQKTPNPSQPWKGNIEIELLPNVTLESSTGGNSGIEGATLKWKRDY